MKKSIFIVFLFFNFITLNHSQTCLPNGIIITSQQQINDFATDYPDCESIGGNVRIIELTSGDITNLNGLSQITSIGKGLYIMNNSSLTSLNGLDNLISIGSSISIDGNDVLTDLNAFSSLNSVSGSLNIANNEKLINFSGLEGIISIEGPLNIHNNSSLKSIRELKNVESISGSIRIRFNDNLVDLTGMEGIKSINGHLNISKNDNLEDLMGLNNATSVGNLRISNNKSLKNLLGLSKIISVYGSLEIVNNDKLIDLEGLNSVSVLGYSLEIEENDLLTSLKGIEKIDTVRDLIINSNKSLKNFSHLNIFSIRRKLSVFDNEVLVNLFGIENLTSIGNAILIFNNESLTSLKGLDNINSVGGYISLVNNPKLNNLIELSSLKKINHFLNINANNSLESLMGLEGIDTIVGDLRIKGNSSLTTLSGLTNLVRVEGFVKIENNDTLLNLNGLENLTSISGFMNIEENNRLISLSGIQNIDPDSFSSKSIHYKDVEIKDNPNLSECEVKSICDFLDLSGKTKFINNNKIGCNNETEIENKCAGSLVIWMSPLSIKILDAGIELNWSVIDQINNEKFEIEFSRNGIDFIKVGEVKGNPDSREEEYYNFKHQYTSIGTVYYRLKQIDYDGEYKYSNIVKISIQENIYSYPNPADNNIIVETTINQKLSVYNNHGKLVKRIELFKGKNDIDISKFNSGLYLFSLETGQIIKVIKE